MPLRVAFDLDGTLADMHVVLRREAEQLFGEPQLASAVEPSGAATDAGDGATTDGKESNRVLAELHLSGRQQMRLWEHVKGIPNFWCGLPEMEPGIVARIAKIAAERRWEVIFITTRPLVTGDTVQLQSQRWLEAHGFTLPSVFVVQRSRGKVADALELDAVVDDRPENCLDVAVDSKAKPILIWPGDPKGVPPGASRLGVRIVASISEALDVLLRLDDAKSETGVVRSIKKFFGKETTV
jgi:hypothetical protein